MPDQQESKAGTVSQEKKERDPRRNPHPGEVFRKNNPHKAPTERIVVATGQGYLVTFRKYGACYGPYLVTFRKYGACYGPEHTVDLKSWRLWARNAEVVESNEGGKP